MIDPICHEYVLEGMNVALSAGNNNLTNRWNFIAANGNVKSQLNKSQSLRTCRRSLHKRLLHHKQTLMDMDQIKKTFIAQEQAGSAISKHQGKQFWKELTQFASKVGKHLVVAAGVTFLPS